MVDIDLVYPSEGDWPWITEQFVETAWASLTVERQQKTSRQSVRNQPGHQVAASGPYRLVRHPGYMGACLQFISTPLLLGSWWALIPAVLAVAGYVLRTALEDRTLRNELPGYMEYTRQVRCRLIPGIW